MFYSYVLVFYPYVTGMYLVCTRMLLVCTRMYSYVTRMYLYVTRMYSCGVLVKIVMSYVFHVHRRQSFDFPSYLVSCIKFQPKLMLKLTVYTNCYNTRKLTVIVNFLRTKQYYWSIKKLRNTPPSSLTNCCGEKGSVAN